MYDLKTCLFYVFAVTAFSWETFVLFYTKKCYHMLRDMGDTKVTHFNKSQANLHTLLSFYGLWVIAGFFSSQWFIFAVIAILYAVNLRKYIIGMFIESFVNVVLLVLMLVNRFYWHFSFSEFFVHLYKSINP